MFITCSTSCINVEIWRDNFYRVCVHLTLRKLKNVVTPTTRLSFEGFNSFGIRSARSKLFVCEQTYVYQWMNIIKFFLLINLDIFSASRLVAEGIRVHVNQSALFMSPLYDASRGGQSRCLRFRYMLQGPGEKALTVYRKTKTYREIPIWISKGITRGNWVYGQVQLSSISDFQVKNFASSPFLRLSQTK